MTRIGLRTHSPRLEWLESRAVPAVVGSATSEQEVSIAYAADDTTVVAATLEMSSTTDTETSPQAIGTLPINPIAPPTTEPTTPPSTGTDQPPLVDPIIPPSGEVMA
jgi:hypothetical protein